MNDLVPNKIAIPVIIMAVLMIGSVFAEVILQTELQSQDIPANLHCVHNPMNNIYMCEGE